MTSAPSNLVILALSGISYRLWIGAVLRQIWTRPPEALDSSTLSLRNLSADQVKKPSVWTHPSRSHARSHHGWIFDPHQTHRKREVCEYSSDQKNQPGLLKICEQQQAVRFEILSCWGQLIIKNQLTNRDTHTRGKWRDSSKRKGL